MQAMGTAKNLASSGGSRWMGLHLIYSDCALHFLIIQQPSTMAQTKFMSRLVAAGLVAGASCFAANGDTFLKVHRNKKAWAGPSSSFVQNKGFHAFTSALISQGKSGLTPLALTTLYAQSTHVSSDESKLPQQISNDRMATSYYLIWSEGFLPKFALVTATLLGLHWAGIASRFGVLLSKMWHTHMMGPWQSVLASSLPNVVLPFLASSCCLLQLMINALVGAGGCAGFNTVLGPVRPVFLSLLAYLNWTARAPLTTGILRLSLALLPEFVHVMNRWLAYAWKNRVEKSLEGADMITATVELEIPTMGCVACINKVDTSMRQSEPDKILEATSWLDADKKGGRARVRMAVNSKEELESMNERIVKSIDGAGFYGARIVGLKFDEDAATEKPAT